MLTKLAQHPEPSHCRTEAQIAQTINPLQWNSAEFSCFLAVVFFGALLISKSISEFWGKPKAPSRALKPVEIAILSGKESDAINVVEIDLMARRVMTYCTPTERIRREALQDVLDEFESIALARALKTPVNRDSTWNSCLNDIYCKEAMRHIPTLQTKLREENLMLQADSFSRLVLLSSAPFLPVIALGAAYALVNGVPIDTIAVWQILSVLAIWFVLFQRTSVYMATPAAALSIRNSRHAAKFLERADPKNAALFYALHGYYGLKKTHDAQLKAYVAMRIEQQSSA
jgi:uncharacterized protein (TIGR04222 family)